MTRIIAFLTLLSLSLAAGGLFPVASFAKPAVPTHIASSFAGLTPQAREHFFAADPKKASSPPTLLGFREPLPGTELPADMAAISFAWEGHPQSTVWLLTIAAGERVLARALLDTTQWIPDESIWTALKLAAGNTELTVNLTGVGGWNGREVISRSATSFRFSPDPVDATLMFMRKPLPFRVAKENPQHTQLLAGSLSSALPPRQLLSGLPVCANCHTYALNGSTLGIDMDYQGDKGAFVLEPMQARAEIGQSDIGSWNTLPARKPAAYSMGLFARLSPTGRYLAGTVNETSVFVMLDNLQFSQLFFPATGHIAIFDRTRNRYFPLAGADAPGQVQTSAAWSPDERTIAFARTPVRPELVQKIADKVIRNESAQQSIAELNRKYPVQFDIYTIPFNGGKGGIPSPLPGASGNGLSNYFPRYSPDGRWIVFTQSPTGLVLQPDSRLMIVPAHGGIARPLASNLPVMNSWHSWSPNSRWLVFTCKARSPYTELYLTHIDDDGNASPPIRLYRFSHGQMAAMVPEFVSKQAVIPDGITLQEPEKARGKSIAIDGR